MFEKVLYPVDFSSSAQKSVEKYLLSNKDAIKEVILLYVIDSSYYDLIDTSKKKLLSELKDKVTQSMTLESERLKPLKVRGVITDGNPAEEIVKLADKEDVSMIIMPSHSSLKFYSGLLGSTTMKVLSKTDKPVLVLKVGK